MTGETTSVAVELRYRIVDVFSDRPLAGNALCVVLDPAPEPVMQAIAREVNLSETTFPTVTGAHTYDCRIFTPAGELPFAGHPTLGTAWVLGAQRWEQTTPGGTIAVTADAAGASMDQPPPKLTEIDAEPLANALGIPVEGRAWVGEVHGTRHALVPTTRPLDRLPPVADPASVLRPLRATGLVAISPVDDATLHVRVFAPGIGEDPGTGSAAGMAATVARMVWSTATTVTIRQGDEIGRPCRIDVEMAAELVRVAGRVTACAVGTFTL